MNVRTVVVSVIAALAAIGLVSMMITSPGQLVQQIVFAVITVAVVMFLLRLFMRNRGGGVNRREDRAYSKAVKQSKKRQTAKSNTKKPSHSVSFTAKPKKKSARRKKATHLTVIEGNKGKRGSRASSE
ncbi:SA1362 family protein [Domibacillus indicus]|uniref:SA1362 family protein n=1 Tax=Domibacillus indicus TaxID=1437523 RepID=UPI000695B008|nr:SA1362 family protein [Domibacillus indicus]